MRNGTPIHLVSRFSKFYPVELPLLSVSTRINCDHGPEGTTKGPQEYARVLDDIQYIHFEQFVWLTSPPITVFRAHKHGKRAHCHVRLLMIVPHLGHGSWDTAGLTDASHTCSSSLHISHLSAVVSIDDAVKKPPEDAGCSCGYGLLCSDSFHTVLSWSDHIGLINPWQFPTNFVRNLYVFFPRPPLFIARLLIANSSSVIMSSPLPSGRYFIFNEYFNNLAGHLLLRGETTNNTKLPIIGTPDRLEVSLMLSIFLFRINWTTISRSGSLRTLRTICTISLSNNLSQCPKKIRSGVAPLTDRSFQGYGEFMK